jgi:FixJ family two-component response regulator
MVTGNDDVEVARRTLQGGAFDYVCKPFTLEVLERLVAAAMVMPRGQRD